MGVFDVDSLGPTFWVPSRGLSCSFVIFSHFTSASVNETSLKASEKLVMRKSLAPNAEVKRVGSANIDADETRRQPTQQAEPAEYSKYCRSSRYSFWKARC